MKVTLDRYKYLTKENNGEIVEHSYTVLQGVKPVKKSDELVETFECEVKG